MDRFASARRTVGTLFFWFISIYLLLNIAVQWRAISDALQLVPFPSSFSEAAETTSAIEQILNDGSYRRFNLINVHSYIQVLLNKEETGDFDMVKSRDGELSYGSFFQWIPSGLETYAIRTQRLKEYANQNGCELIYLSTIPMYISRYSDYTPGLPFRNVNTDIDAMLYYMQGYGIDYMDMRAALRQSGLSPERYRYRTDHHWTIEASFEGFRALVRKLEDQYGVSLDPGNFYTDRSNYREIVYENAFCGSLALRAGIPFAGWEDFTLLLPGFPTRFDVERSDGAQLLRRSGAFENVLVDADFLNASNLYMSYLGGPRPFWHIDNLNNTDGLKMLVIGDSFSLPLSAFMAACVSEVDLIYPLSETMFGDNVDIDDYVAEHIGAYDFIILQIDPSNYNDEAFYFFQTAEEKEAAALGG